MPDTWITDLRHFLDSDGLLVDGPAGRLASYWCQLVEAATARPDGLSAQPATRCRRSASETIPRERSVRTFTPLSRAGSAVDRLPRGDG